MRKNGEVHFKVQRGVPLPIPHASTPRKYHWPFGTMKIGDCFFISTKDIHDVNRMRPVVMGAAKEWRQTGRRFVTRLMAGDKKLGVWRIA